MSNISNGAPRFILNGIRDDSVPAPVAVPETYPQHLPHVYFLAERGSLLPQLTDPTMLSTVYGSKSFDYLEKYFTLGTAFANTFAGAPNLMITQRVHPADALKPSIFTLGIELVSDTITDYVRATDGSVVRNTDGSLQLGTATRTGMVGRLVVNRDITRAVGAGVVTKGLMTSSTLVQSDFYPLLDLEVPSPGAFGNNVGLSLWAPNSLDINPLNLDVAVDQLSQLYRLAFYERDNAQTTPVNKLTTDNRRYIDFSFAPGVIDTATTTKYGLQLRIGDYANSGDDGTFPYPGPMGNAFVYQANLALVLNELFALEQPVNANLLTGPGAQNQINVISGLDFYANPYYTFRLQGTAEGGINLNDVSIYYAAGGSDGEMTTAVYDALVKEQFDNYGQLDGIQMLDSAQFPVSAYWDAGYSLDTKKSMISLLGKRKDIAVYVSMFLADSDHRLTGLEQRSMGTSLRAYAQLFPESTLFGTATCRAVFFMQSGQLTTDDSGNYFPAMLDFAYKKARYAGSSDGVLKNEYAYDAEVNNQVQIMKNLDLLWELDSTRNAEWGAGLNYAMTYQRKSAYMPFVQTVYSTEASVLKDETSLAICVDIERQCQIAFRQLGTDTRRTTAQTLQRLNTILQGLTKDKYDNRVVISINSFQTVKDAASRVRYSCEVSAAFNKGMYIGSFTVVSQNQQDLS